jgi:hypothetical protein
MVDDKLVREIAKLVSRKLLEYQKNAMVVFTGTTIGTDVALEALCDLKEQGFTYHVLLSHSASKVLDVEKIRASLKPEDLWLGCSERTPEDLCSKYETILVPALTINSAARVANCMSDTVATSIILNGLLRRKTVVLSIDGCCPDVQKQINGGVPLPPILEGRLRSNLELLQGYGAILTKSSDMSSTVQKAIREAIRFMPAPAKQEPSSKLLEKYQEKEQRDITCSSKKVVSARDVLACPGKSVLRIRPGSIVTQLAREVAQERAVMIEVET